MSNQNTSASNNPRAKFNASCNPPPKQKQGSLKSLTKPSGKKSPFSSLHHRGKKLLRIKPTTSALLMTMADDQHKNIATLIKAWIKES